MCFLTLMPFTVCTCSVQRESKKVLTVCIVPSITCLLTVYVQGEDAYPSFIETLLGEFHPIPSLILI